MKFPVLCEDPPAFPRYWKPTTIYLEKSLFSETDTSVCRRKKRERGTAQFYIPVWLPVQSPIPKCLWRSRSCHLKRKPRQVWCHFSMEISHYFSVRCHKTESFFLSLFYLLTSFVLGKHASQLKKHLSSLATTLLFSTPQKAGYASWTSAGIPYSIIQWEKSTSASVTWCRCNQKRGQREETLNQLCPCLL